MIDKILDNLIKMLTITALLIEIASRLHDMNNDDK